MQSYTCPMHPDVKGEKNEKCPKCSMKLVPAETPLKKVAFMATLHCLTGCSIGEILGMVLGTMFGWPNIETIIVSIILAFFFGYSLTLFPLLRSNMSLRHALPIAFASDTISITIMEIVDNMIMYFIPGAMDAHITSSLFWGSLLFSLAIAFLFAYPVNMYLISKGKGHAAIHKHH
jgi:hypothetical protein